jgi:plastocyanin
MKARIPIGGIVFGIAGLITGNALALNNCLDANFVDFRGERTLVIANDVPLQPHRYRPACATVSEGTTIVFRAVPNFGSHPLYGGLVAGGMATIDPESPIGSINSGSEAERVLVESGEFPFFCDFHYDMGMMGSIRVVPELFADSFDGAGSRGDRLRGTGR